MLKMMRGTAGWDSEQMFALQMVLALVLLALLVVMALLLALNGASGAAAAAADAADTSSTRTCQAEFRPRVEVEKQRRYGKKHRRAPDEFWPR